MSNETKKHDIFWKVAVILLFVIVGIQTAIIYSAMKNNGNSVRQLPAGDTVIRPRPVCPQYSSSPNMMQQKNQPLNTGTCNQGIKIRPLPTTHLNLNNISGIRPSSQPQKRMNPIQQTNPVFSIQMPSCRNSMMAGMNTPPSMNIQDEFDRMQKLMNSMFSNSGMRAAMNRHNAARSFSVRSNGPSLTEDKSNYVVKITMPGLDESNIKASVHNNILTLSGVQKEENEQKSQYGRSYSSSYSSFRNSFSLPGPIKSDGVQVNYKGDILTVTVPKA